MHGKCSRSAGHRRRSLCHWLAIILLVHVAPSFAETDRQTVKVVVAAMYEIGDARNDSPGEIQFWVGINSRGWIKLKLG